MLFGGVRKPVFTADAAHNHLITLAEVLAMYLLVWSPAGWAGLDVSPPPDLAPGDAERYAREARVIDQFVEGLPAVRRLLAHLPVAMVFDDHDVTDDWNLNRDWEDTAYSHPFSNRVIGNALLAYLVNQGWGNRPEPSTTSCWTLCRPAWRPPARPRTTRSSNGSTASRAGTTPGTRSRRWWCWTRARGDGVPKAPRTGRRDCSTGRP